VKIAARPPTTAVTAAIWPGEIVDSRMKNP
jgi:hypothetical protein